MSGNDEDVIGPSAEEVEMVQQFIEEEMREFEKTGNYPVTQDDIYFAAHLRKEIATSQAFLNMLRRGEITCHLNYETEDFDDAMIERTEKFKGVAG